MCCVRKWGELSSKVEGVASEVERVSCCLLIMGRVALVRDLCGSCLGANFLWGELSVIPFMHDN